MFCMGKFSFCHHGLLEYMVSLKNPVSNAFLMNLFIKRGQWKQIITKTCREFNVVRLKTDEQGKLCHNAKNFTNRGSELRVSSFLPITPNEVMKLFFLAYFHSQSNFSILWIVQLRSQNFDLKKHEVTLKLFTFNKMFLPRCFCV